MYPDPYATSGYDLMATIIAVLVCAALFSVCYDLATYDMRQDRWEKAHPGSTYIRGYRKKMKQMEKQVEGT